MQVSNLNSLFGPTATKAKSNAGALSTNSEATKATAVPGAVKSDDADPSQEFLKLAKMNPFERMRANILKSMGLSEADLTKMPPDQQAAIQQKITDTIREQMQKNGAQSGSVVNVTA